MKIYNVVQNTPQWHDARRGVITASWFAKIITPARGDLSAQSDGYENRVIAELLTGEPIDDFGGNKWTDRGHELEPEAVAWYEMYREMDVKHAGFVSNDAETVGCSPDGLVDDAGVLEIKCLAPQTIVGMLLEKSAEQGYYPQLQGQLLVTGRVWVDILFYHPKLPPLIKRVERNDAYIKKLSEALTAMENNIQTKLKIIGRPIVPRKKFDLVEDKQIQEFKDVRMGG